MSKTTQVYVLRVWHEDREVPNWRASLTDLGSSEKRHFASPDAFVKFVGELVGSQEQALQPEKQTSKTRT